METEFKSLYEEQDKLKFFDCDYIGRMKLSAILKRTAEIAGADYTIKGFGHKTLWEKEMVFLLSRVSIKIFRYPVDQEKLIVRTWERGKKGAMFLRGCEIVGEDNELAISIQNGWILANPITRHIYKPSHFGIDMPQDEERQIFASNLEKIKYNELKHIGNRKVRVTDIDENGHVYNAVYSDIACDFMPKSLFEKNIEDFRINFISEAVLGDDISLYSQESEDNYIVVGKNGEKICFECEFIYK